MNVINATEYTDTYVGIYNHNRNKRIHQFLFPLVFFIKKNYVKVFFSIYRDNVVAFLLIFFNMVYFIEEISNPEPSLHSWHNSHLVMV